MAHFTRIFFCRHGNASHHIWNEVYSEFDGWQGQCAPSGACDVGQHQTSNLLREFPYCPWEMPRNVKNNYSHSYDVNWIFPKLLFVRYHLIRVCSSFISREVGTTYISHTFSRCASFSIMLDKKQDGETRQNRSFCFFCFFIRLLCSKVLYMGWRLPKFFAL